MFSAYKLRDIYIIWLMILQGICIARKNIWLQTVNRSIATIPIVWVMLRLWLFLSYLTPVVFAASGIKRSMFANIWNGCFYVRCPIIVSYNWSRKYCFLWLFSSRKYCREPVPTSVLLTQLSCVYVVTWESWFIRHLKAFAGVENVLSDGYQIPVTSNN